MPAFGYSAEHLKQWDETGIDPHERTASGKPLVWWIEVFRTNWALRLDLAQWQWRRVHRAMARNAVANIRYLTGRQRKAFGPSHYGHKEM